MPETEVKSLSKANVVEGFSDRFNQLMDRARFPKDSRISVGSRRFDVVPNTFKNWCVENKIPGKHSLLIEIVESLLGDIPGRHNPRAVVAWLLAGDAVPNPFEDDTDALIMVELYFQISDTATREGIDFDHLPREVRNLILRRTHSMLGDHARDDDNGLRLDDAATSMIVGMLETAQTMA